jgi:hypothetical protein
VAALPDVLARTAVPIDAARKRVAATPHLVPGSAASAGPLPREAVIVLGLSGRGDKDLAALASADSRPAIGLKEAGR